MLIYVRDLTRNLEIRKYDLVRKNDQIAICRQLGLISFICCSVAKCFTLHFVVFTPLNTVSLVLGLIAESFGPQIAVGAMALVGALGYGIAHVMSKRHAAAA